MICRSNHIPSPVGSMLISAALLMSPGRDGTFFAQLHVRLAQGSTLTLRGKGVILASVYLICDATFHRRNPYSLNRRTEVEHLESMWGEKRSSTHARAITRVRTESLATHDALDTPNGMCAHACRSASCADVQSCQLTMSLLGGNASQTEPSSYRTVV